MPSLPPNPLLYEVNTIAWLSELSRRAGTAITLGTVPAEEWDAITDLGVHAVWLMGVWERSPAGLKVALADAALRADFERALPDVTLADIAGSPYCVRRYVVDPQFGGRAALAVTRERLASRGVGLVLDFVPNHVARDHPWVDAHPDWFIQGTIEDLAADSRAYFRAGDAVIACGRDPYFPPWSDVAQVNAFAPGLRAVTVDTLIDVASQCDGVRCDMAMLEMSDVFAGTWGARAGPRPREEFWEQVIAKVRDHAPDFTFIAEAYWDREWALQQQGFDFCYDKRLYDRLVHADAAEVRGHLRADRAYQDRLLRFIENHDEPRATAVLGPKRARADAALIAAVPGMRLFHQGQLEGRTVRLPVFLTRWPDEPVDEALRAFYAALLSDASAPVFRTGDWSLLECSGWPGNDSCGNFVACSWAQGTERRLVIVNLSDVRSQGRVALPWAGLGGRSWVMRDVVNGDVFHRNGDELAPAGLYVDLEGWQFHWLRVDEAWGVADGHQPGYR